MIRTIESEHVRTHTLSDKSVKCFKTSVGLTDGYIANTGDWITYVEDEHGNMRTGRMIGRVDYAPACGEIEVIRGYLSVLSLSENLCYAYIRWVKPEDVRGIRKAPPAAFLAFMTGPLPTADIVHKLQAYGTLSDSYIDKAPHHIKAFELGVSPAAYDCGVRKADV